MKNKPKIILLSLICTMLMANSVRGYAETEGSTSETLTPDIIVAKDGSGDYSTIKNALVSVPEDNSSLFIILIKNGLYKDKILIDKDFVLLMGESRENTKIIYAEQKWVWQCKNDPSDPLPAVVNVTGNDCIIMNMTIKNNYGDLYYDKPLPELECNIENYEGRVKPNGHQYAFLLKGNATRLIVLNCNIIAAGADTFCPWNKETGMYYIKDTYFEGYTDYVCPRGDCYITDSKFFTKGGSATLWHDGSNSTNNKFVINNSRFEGVDDFKLGRYTHDAQIIILNSTFGSNIADKNIYQAKPDVFWGHRIFYYNCSRDEGNYSWMNDNLKLDPSSLTPINIFGGKWDPEKFIKDNNLLLHYN